MKDIIIKLRKRFTLVCVIISGATLLVLLSSIYASTRLVTSQRITQTLEASLLVEGFGPRPMEGKPDRCLKISVVGDNIATEGFDIYEDDKLVDDIIYKAITIKNGPFQVDGNYFTVLSTEKTYNDVYAIYDRTVDMENANAQLQIMMIVFFFTLVFITFISWKLSKKFVAPVNDAFDKQKELIANASHELKTPLAVINTNLSVIESDPTKTISENMKWLDNINSLVGRMDSLILEMLDLSHIENDKYLVDITTINISDLLKGILLTFDVNLYEKKINLETAIDDDIEIKSSKNGLEKLFSILVENAIKYTDESGKITVNMHLSNSLKKIEIHIRNTGEGIDSIHLNKIFDRFYKVDESRTSNNATRSFGLGLSIAKSIVVKLGGSIDCQSVINEYTEFVVILPI